MYFQLSRGADQWFADISKHYATKFDLYYLCLVAGLAARRKEDPEDATDVIDYYPGEFKPRGRLLVALLINAELKNLGIDLQERDAVHRAIAKLVQPTSPSYLTDEGVRLLNKYAHGGFGALREHFADRPRAIETFLRKYSVCLAELQNESKA